MYSQHVCQHYVCLFIYSISIIQSPEFTVGWVWWREKNGWPRRRYLSNKSVITIFMIWIFGNFDLIHNKQWNEESVGFGRQHARTLKVGPWPMGRLSLLRGAYGPRRKWQLDHGRAAGLSCEKRNHIHIIDVMLNSFIMRALLLVGPGDHTKALTPNQGFK
jgi:hypothetical protein